MFSIDAFFFFSQKNIKRHFHAVNLELNKAFKQFNANLLSLNKNETTYTLFPKARERGNIPLRLLSQCIIDKEIKQISSINFLRVLIDQYLTCREHIKVVENKISKKLSFFCKTKRVLDVNPFLVFTQLLNGNIIWSSTTKTKLKTQQVK